MRFWFFGLFFDGDGAFVIVKLHYAEAFRVFYLVAEYSGALSVFGIIYRFFQLGGEALAVENIVT